MVNLDNMEKAFNEEVQRHLKDARQNCTDLKGEYVKQQQLYTKYASAYDYAMNKEEYNAPRFAASAVNTLFTHNKDVKVLDYGCGSGLVGDLLIHEFGFKNIDGLDPCKELLDEARLKGKMQNYFETGSDEGHSSFPSNTYDVICSSGVFFVSPSHPGFECFPELCRMVKKGGHIVISTGDYYLQFDHVNFQIVEDLEKQGKIKVLPKKILKNYRKPAINEGSNPIMGAVLTYQVL